MLCTNSKAKNLLKKEALPCDFFQVFDDLLEDCGRQNDWTTPRMRNLQP